MARTDGDDDAPARPGDAAGPDNRPASVDPPSLRDDPVPGRDKRYDDAAEQVTESMSAADREEFRTAIDELRGDFVAGNKYTIWPGHRGVTVRAYRIPGETLAHPHVAATGLPRIEDVVRRHGIVAVRGPEGSGRAAALLRVFAGGSPQITVLRLHPQTDLRTLAPEHFHDAHAVILEDLTEDHLDQLDDFELGRLRDELADRWLGFTVAASIDLPAALTSMVVDIGEPPPADEVFRQHFRAAQPSSRRRDALLDAAGVRERIDAALRPPVRLARAAELAAFLAAYEGPVEELAGRLDAWLTLGADAERLRWFQALPSLRAHCTALSLAVFHGLARATVMAQADRLVEQIAPTPENEKRDDLENPFMTGVPLTTLRATATRESVAYAEGDITETVLRYADPAYQPWVLQHAWDEFDAAQPAIMAWLRELGNDADQSVRVRAAGAAGVLAERAFRTVHNEVIADWAAGPGIVPRRSAALALSAPAADPELAPAVDRMLKGWISGKNPDWQATAALLLGITADPANVADCLSKLADLAEHDDTDVAIAVATSLSDMLASSGGVMGGHVLHEVTVWMNRRAWRGRRFTGHLAFLRLTFLAGDPTVPRREDPNRAVPSLLIGARRSEAFARQISRAWHDGLTERLSRALLRSLAKWAEHVEKRPEYEPIFVWLLRQAATDVRTVTVLTRAARSWTLDTAPRTAATVLATLTEVAGTAERPPLIKQRLESGTSWRLPRVDAHCAYVLAYGGGELRAFSHKPQLGDRARSVRCYVVDTSPRSLHGTLRIPARGDRYFFDATYDAQWRVADPVAGGARQRRTMATTRLPNSCGAGWDRLDGSSTPMTQQGSKRRSTPGSALWRRRAGCRWATGSPSSRSLWGSRLTRR